MATFFADGVLSVSISDSYTDIEWHDVPGLRIEPSDGLYYGFRSHFSGTALYLLIESYTDPSRAWSYFVERRTLRTSDFTSWVEVEIENDSIFWAWWNNTDSPSRFTRDRDFSHETVGMVFESGPWPRRLHSVSYGTLDGVRQRLRFFVGDTEVGTIPSQYITPSDWAAEDVNTAIAANLVPPRLQSRYTQATTRAEFAALAVTLYEHVHGEITGRSTFEDTRDINVQKAAYVGLVQGVGDNRFAPDNNLTREQAAVLVTRLADAIGHPFPNQAPDFADNALISDWALEGVGRAQAAGIMGGVGNNNFAPQGPYTREQSIITMLRLFEMLD
jgi:hypothetical protein